MLLGEHHTDEADRGVAVGKDPDDVGAAADMGDLKVTMLGNTATHMRAWAGCPA